MTFNYCDLNFPITCYSKSVFGILPSITLLLLGQWSLRDLNFETQDLQLPLITSVHGIKLIFSLALMLLYLSNLLLYVVVFEEDYEFVTILVLALGILNWFLNMIILRKEYKRLGYTSSYLRIFWLIAMISDLALGFILPIENTNKMNLHGIISFCSTVCLVTLNIYGYVNRKDSPKAIIIDDLRDQFVKVKVIEGRVSNPLDVSCSTPQKPESGKEISNEGIMEKFLNIKRNKKENNDRADLEEPDVVTLNPYKKSVYEEVEEIGIPRIEETFKNGKSTRVYVILYLMNKKILTTRRSYSEIQRLYRRTKEIFPNESLPPFPIKNMQSIAERKQQLEAILNYICEKKLFTKYLYEFLKTEEELPFFGYMSGINSRKSSYQPPEFQKSFDAQTNSFVQSEERKSTQSKKSRKTLSFGQSFGTKDVYSFLRDSNQPKFENTDSDLNYKVIKNYKRFSLRNTDSNVYKINILTTEIRGTDKPEVFYHVQVSYSGFVKIVIKQYRDFEDLHEEMLNFADESDVDMQDLPDRGNLGFMTSKFDQKLIDYRKFALKNYLQYIMFSTTLRYCPAIRNFLDLNYSITDSI